MIFDYFWLPIMKERKITTNCHLIILHIHVYIGGGYKGRILVLRVTALRYK